MGQVLVLGTRAEEVPFTNTSGGDTAPVTTATGVRIVRAGRDQRRDRARKYKILVDGIERDAVGAGEAVLTPVAAGQPSVQVKIDWLGSDTMTVSLYAGEVVSSTCSPNGTSGPALFDILQGTSCRKPWVSLSPRRE